MNLGIAELWTLHLDEAHRDLEEALALARRIGRPYLEVGCLGHLALVSILENAPPDASLRLSEAAAAIAVRHGWGTHRILVPAVAAAAIGLAWLGRTDEARAGSAGWRCGAAASGSRDRADAPLRLGVRATGAGPP